MKFEDLDLSDDLLDALDAMHFDECTPIQERAIPIALEGRDLLAVAQTGTGKTAAYLLPVIDEIFMGGYPEDRVNCVVMAPTRELAQQIDHQLQGFTYYMPVTSMPVYGGTDGYTYEQQRKGLKQGADIIVATPGRLLAHLSMGYVDLSKVSFLVLDEADRMLDMGFYDDIMQIAARMPKDRQTLMFSATMPPKIRQLASAILVKPEEIRLSMSKPAEKIDQRAYVCYETQKIPLLLKIISEGDFGKVIIFGSSKLKVKELARALKGKNLQVGEMHSDLEQSMREDMMIAFKSGRISILVATDIVARGIDIDDIDLVVNFDVPHECEDYVHRIGRTARAERDGIAITLVSEKDRSRFRRIESFLEKEVSKHPLPEELGECPDYIAFTQKNNSSGDKKGKSRYRRGKKQGNKSKIANHPAQSDSQLSSSANQQGRKKFHHRRRKSGSNSSGPVSD